MKLAAEYGAIIGRELRDQGFNMSLGGGINLMIDPRNGRNFEYKGEDPNSGTPTRRFDIPYTHGLKIGYKWFDAENKEPLFPFGFGMSYTAFAYSGLKVTPGKMPRLTFQVKNTGGRAGTEIAQVYVALPASTGEPPKRLVAWDRVELKAGEIKTVTLTIDPFLLSIFSVEKDGWEFVPGEYKFLVGASSRDLPLSATVVLSN